MRLPYPTSHYESKLFAKYHCHYTVIPSEDYHGMRTWCNIYCHKHKTMRSLLLGKLFNGHKSMVPCRQCFIEHQCECHSPTGDPPTENDLAKNLLDNVDESVSLVIL